MSYFFEFDANTHKLYYQSYTEGHTLIPNSARRLFEGLASNLEITQKYNLAKVSIVQHRRSLDDLFSIRRIDEIEITLLRPNPDIFADDFEAKIEAHLEQTNSRSVVVRYGAEPGRSIEATPEIRAISEVAIDNGHVEVKGRDEVGAVKLSTEEYPFELQSKFDPDETLEGTAFRRLVADSKVAQ